MDLFNRPETIVGSGLYIASDLILQSVDLTAPYLKCPPEIDRHEQGPETVKFIQYAKKQDKIFPVREPQLKSYADKLLEVSRKVKELGYDVVLCPLRGARMAGLTSELVTQSKLYRPFDGTDMAQKVNDERILKDLRRLILQELPPNEQRKIGVIDTASGGDSCRELTRLLKQLNCETKETWTVDFHLIHQEGPRPSRASMAYGHTTKTLQIDIRYYPVASLLVEDEPELLGYDKGKNAGGTHIVRLQQDGQIMVLGHDSVTTYRTAPVDETLIALVSQEMQRLIRTLPDIKPVDMDYWA